jgi:hypothetical protein
MSRHGDTRLRCFGLSPVLRTVGLTQLNNGSVLVCLRSGWSARAHPREEVSQIDKHQAKSIRVWLGWQPPSWCFYKL